MGNPECANDTSPFYPILEAQANTSAATFEHIATKSSLSVQSAYWQTQPFYLSVVLIFVPGLLLAEGSNWARYLARRSVNLAVPMEVFFAFCSWLITLAFISSWGPWRLLFSAILACNTLLCVRVCCV